MREFWVSFKMHMDHVAFEGDLITDMADDDKLNAAYLKNLQSEIRKNMIDQVVSTTNQMPKNIGSVIILSLIPLETEK